MIDSAQTDAASFRVHQAIDRGERPTDEDLRDCSDRAREWAQAVGRTKRDSSKRVVVHAASTEKPIEIKISLPTTVDVQINPDHVIAFLLGGGWVIDSTESTCTVVRSDIHTITIPHANENPKYVSSLMGFAIRTLARVYCTEPYILWSRIRARWDMFKVPDSADHIQIDPSDDEPARYFVLLNGMYTSAWSRARTGFDSTIDDTVDFSSDYAWTLREAIDEALKAVAYRVVQLKASNPA